MIRGRKPQPTVLKLLAGNPGKRPINKNEPVPEGELCAPPGWMTDSQKEGWRYALQNAPKGLLRFIDRGQLTIWVCAENDHRKAAEKVAQEGQVIKAPNTGYPIQSPYMAIQNKQAHIMMKAADALGFNPTSRSRITLQGEAPEQNRFAKNGKRSA